MVTIDPVRHALVRSAARRRAARLTAGRVFDLVLSAVALVFFLPLMGLVALAIASERSGPILFRHERVGLGGSRFGVLKFRTMRVGGDAILAQHLASDQAAAQEWESDHKLRFDPRVSKLGAFLRRASLDELPQFWNVLIGDMSIVGPRPIVEAEIARYGKFFHQYCSVRPGITGIWQVSGRNDISYRRRVLMDALYARRKSVLLDLSIVLATVPAVLRRKGSY